MLYLIISVLNKESQQNYLNCTEKEKCKNQSSIVISAYLASQSLSWNRSLSMLNHQRQTYTDACTHSRLKDCLDIPNPFEFFQPSGAAWTQLGRGTFRQCLL